MTNIVVFASGTGTNFQAIIDAIENGTITDAQITGLIASKPEIEAIERALKHDIPVQVLERGQYSDEQAFSDQILADLNEFQANLIVLAGYLEKIPPSVIKHYEGRIINIHPSLLPAYGGKGYYGKKVHRAVLDNGDEVTGCTVHFVNEKYDDGPIIDQRKVWVQEDDTPESLAKRVSKEEHKLLPDVIQNLIHKDKQD